jgi:hypothetical protein
VTFSLPRHLALCLLLPCAAVADSFGQSLFASLCPFNCRLAAVFRKTDCQKWLRRRPRYSLWVNESRDLQARSNLRTRPSLLCAEAPRLLTLCSIQLVWRTPGAFALCSSLCTVLHRVQLLLKMGASHLSPGIRLCSRHIWHCRLQGSSISAAGSSNTAGSSDARL